jgi:hypothetical protein
MNIFETIGKLKDKEVAQLLDLAAKRVSARNLSSSVTNEELNLLSGLDENNKINFQRILLCLLVAEENDISNFLKNEIEFMVEEGPSRGVSQIAIDIVAVAGILLPLIQTKIKIHYSKAKGVTFELGWDSENTKVIIQSILKPIELLASKIKKFSFGNISMSSDEKKEID